MTEQLTTFEIVDIEGFADRMGVSRTTVFEWIKVGVLQPGRHFIKIGRVIRFAWGERLLQHLHEDSLDHAPVAEDRPLQERSSLATRVTPKPPGATIDLDYR